MYHKHSLRPVRQWMHKHKILIDPLFVEEKLAWAEGS
jgi:hypothetical protein